MKKLLATAILLGSANSFSIIEGDNPFARIDRACGPNPTCQLYSTMTSWPTMVIEEQLAVLEDEGTLSSLLDEALGESETTLVTERYAGHFEISVDEMKSIALELSETVGLSMDTLTEAISKR